MSVCPKCGQKLRPVDLGQMCPHCGVNMRFHDFDKRFIHDAKAAELSMAKVSIKLRRFKAAFIGGKLPKSRLVLMLLPLLSTLIPTANVTIKLPFLSKDLPLSALGLFNMFSDGTLSFIGAMTGSDVDGAAFTLLRNTVSSLAAVAVCAVLVLLFSILCFINIKRMSIVQCVTSVAGVAACALCAFFAFRLCSANSVMLSGSMSFGFAITVLMFATVFAVNAAIVKKGIEIEYEEGTLERAEIAKKVKRGEIKLDDLPQPIVETAETRRIDDEIAKEKQKLATKGAQTE